MTRSGFSFTCILIKQSNGYTALCTELDVASEGPTPAKAKRLLQEAVELYLDSAIESNLPYMRPIPKANDPRQTQPESIIEDFNIHVDLSVQVHA